jgi:hypothetical protein
VEAQGGGSRQKETVSFEKRQGFLFQNDAATTVYTEKYLKRKLI